MNIINNLLETFCAQSFWVKALELMLALGILVIVHEFGHYSFARLFRMRVDKFYLFFNPKFSILRWDPRNHKLDFFKRNPGEEEEKAREEQGRSSKKASWRDTVYGIGWIPLGGYCSIAGMVDETTNASELNETVQPWEFRARPAWQRLLVMIGGVLFNFLLAIVIYAGIVLTYGEQLISFEHATEGMEYCDAAHKVGFVDGDIPLSADGEKLTYLNSESLQAMLMARQVTVLRNHKDTVTIDLPKDFVFQANKDAEAGQAFIDFRWPVVVNETMPRQGAEIAGLKRGDRLVAVNNDSTPCFTMFSKKLMENKGKTVVLTFMRDGKLMMAKAPVDKDGKLGFSLTNLAKIYQVEVKRYNLFQSIPRGIQMGWDKLTSYVKSLKLVASKEGAQSLGGFGAIGSIFPDTWNWLDFWNITAFISVILAVMNILPIPILDGGYVLFLLIEMITGWKPSEKFMTIALNIGLTLLVLLLIYANLNDVYRFLIK